jgi:hypothetical protein
MSEGIIGQLVDGYIKLRDRKAEMKAKHEAELAPVNSMMEQIETRLLAEMQKQGVESYRTTAGTAYTSTTTRANVADWDSLLGFVREHSLWQMLERRVSKSAVDEYVAAHKDLPPGVNYSTAVAVNIRRG